MSYIRNMSINDRIAKVAKVLATIKTSGYSINDLYSHEFPELSDIEDLNLTYPYMITMEYQGENTAGIRSAARKLGLIVENEIIFHNADDIYDMFSTLERNIDAVHDSMNDVEYDTDEERSQDENDAYGPAAELARLLGWKLI